MGAPGLSKRLALAAMCAALWQPMVALADGLSGGVGLVSDKVVRGFSQSGGSASAVADVVWRDDTGWALSAGAATLGRHNPRGDVELTVGASLGGTWGTDGAWQLAASQYRTLGPAATRRPDYAEALVAVAWQQLRATLTVVPDYINQTTGAKARRGSAMYVEATWHQPLHGLAPQLQGFALDAGVGRAGYQRVAVGGYGYGNVGLAWAQGPWQLTASRIFSSSGSSNAAGPRVVLSLLYSF